MTGQSLLCNNADAITADWMQRALAANGDFGSPQLKEIAVDHLGSATHALGSLLRCRLTPQDGSPPVPETVIVKLPTTDRTALRVARWLSLHKREYDYYRHVAQHSPMRSPTLYYGEFGARSRRVVLVLEDLRGMETVVQATGVGAERAGLAVRQVARLHGRFWDAVDRPPVIGLYDTFSLGYARFMQTAYLVCLPRVFDRFGSLFSPNTRRFAETLGPRIVAHFRNVAMGPKTLIHGDYRAENMFFGTEAADDFAAIDWQGCGIGSGMYDVAYFMATSVPIDDRRRIERGALEEYHDIVCHMGAKNYSFDDCWRSYRQDMLGAFLPCILGCGGLKMEDQRLVDLARAGLRRMLTAIEDLEADEFLPAHERFMAGGYGFSTLSLWGYRSYELARRLRRK